MPDKQKQESIPMTSKSGNIAIFGNPVANHAILLGSKNSPNTLNMQYRGLRYTQRGFKDLPQVADYISL